MCSACACAPAMPAYSKAAGVRWPFTESESSGVVNEEKIVSIPYNDLEKSLVILEKHSKDLAGVIIEPVLGGGGCIPAEPDYLRGIQEFCKKNNSLFILDEIVTGFRFRYGCLYPTMKLDPDIVTLGKIVGGGMAIGVICGKKEIMEFADTTGKKKSERSYVGGGTFSANPISMTTGFTTLSILKNGKSIYSKINDLGEYARKELTKVFGEDVIVTGKGSLFMTHFVKNGINQIRNSADAAQCDTIKLQKYHFNMISKNKVFFLPGKLGAISNAHGKEDIKKMISASDKMEL